ncbi:MAG: hypothetical protein QW273_03835, partial [Candidatus Pacearchaeota archaeon]
MNFPEIENIYPIYREKEFFRILSDIKAIKIQGANNVAKAGIKAFLLFPDEYHARLILETRPTEPLLQNFINILLHAKDKERTARFLLDYMQNSQNKINREGFNLIKNNMKIFTHCHSSTLIEMLKYAKKKNKKFFVYTGEVAPLYQGRKTAKELAKEGVHVFVVPDFSAGFFLRKCDLLLFGADAYTKKYIYNKIGTSTLVQLASLYGIPSYSLGFCLKYSTKELKIERRDDKELWKQSNPNIHIEYFSF